MNFLNRHYFYALFALFSMGAYLTASAQPILYTQNFDSPVGAHGNIYFTDSPSYNGITDGSSSGGISTGASFVGNSNQNGRIVTTITAGYGTITAAQSGSYFLYQNTNASFSAPIVVFSTQGTTITLTQNTNYTFSFYLDNQDNTSVATIQPYINGTAIGSTLSAAGVNNWNKFSVTWNSGSATSGIFELDNTNLNGVGNDFGIDSIQIAGVPEPRDWAIWGLIMVMGLVTGHRKFASSLKS